MTELIFDLQRFANITTQEELDKAISEATAGDTITLTGNITDGTGLTIDKNITIDFGEFTYSGTGTITVNEGSTANLKSTSNGGVSGINIANSGTLTLDGIALTKSTVSGAGNATFTDVAFSSNSSVSGTGTNTYNVSTQATLQSAITAAKAGDTVTLTADIANGTGLTIAKNITVDFGNHIYTTSKAITTEYGAEVTLQNGTISASSAITNKGTLKLATMTISGSVTASSGTISPTSSTITLANGQAVKLGPASTQYDAATSGKYITFEYSENGTPSIKGLEVGSSFTATISNDNVVTYTVDSKGAGLSATSTASSGITKIYTGEYTLEQNVSIPLTEFDFDGTTFASAFIIKDGELTINKTKTDSMTADAPFIVVSSTDYKNQYGTLTKNTDGTFKLVKGESTGTLASITISNNLVVEVGKEFVNIPITTNNSTSFQILESEGLTDFTVSGGTRVTLTGANNISLGSGNMAANTGQTVNASNYSVYGYTDKNSTNNGIYLSADSNNSSKVTIGGIDNGESFTVYDGSNTATYTRNDFGLITRDSSDNIKKIYMGATVTGDDLAVDLSSLASGMRPFITPDENKVLTIGANGNTTDAVVLSNASPTGTGEDAKKYAELKVTNTTPKSYELVSIEGGTQLSGNIETISVAGGATTIETALVKDVTIATKATTFIVTATGSKTSFIVDGTKDTPEITNATELTLLTGQITATQGQKITLGKEGKPLTITKTSSSGVKIAVSSDGSNYTISGAAGDVFDFNNKTYTIGSKSDGITFTIDKTSGEITFSDFAATDKDVLTIGDESYSIRGAGFVKKDSTGEHLWTGDGKPSLSGGSVTGADLGTANNWGDNLLLVSVNGSDNLATLNSFTGKAVLIGDDYKNFFGNIEKTSSAYSITTMTGALGLKNVYVKDGTALTMGAGLTNVVLRSDNATVSVIDDAGDGYGVTLSASANDATKVSAGETATLISGAMKVDSSFSAKAFDNVVTGVKDAAVTLTTSSNDAIISGLVTEENKDTFKLNNKDYSYTAVGIVDNGKYLFGTGQGSVTIGNVSTGEWGILIAASELTITSATGSALVVDDTVKPQNLYADLSVDKTSGTKTLSKSSGGADWSTANATIHVDNTNVSFKSDFANAAIQGDKSGAIFTVTDKDNFSVADSEKGATIGSATHISQTAGLIAPTNTQTIYTTDGTITGATGVNVNVNSTGNTFITALDSTVDAFTVGETSYNKYGLGLFDNNDRLLTAENAITDNSVAVTLLSDEDNWTYTAKANYRSDYERYRVNVPQTVGSDKWIIVDSGKASQFGTMTATSDGSYTINQTNSNLAVSLSTSKTYLITDDDNFTVKDGAKNAAATITGAAVVTLVSGAVALTDPDAKFIYNGTSDTVTVQGSSIELNEDTIKALDKNDVFIVNDTQYTLLSSGRFLRKDNALWNSDTIATINGTVATGDILSSSNWNGWIPIEADEKFVIGETVVAAVKNLGKGFVAQKDDPSKIYGTFSTISGGYQLAAAGATADATLEEITLDKEYSPVVKFASTAFQKITINAGDDASFLWTKGSTIAANYNENGVSVEGATGLTLLNGTINSSLTTQVITAGDNTLSASIGTITVYYDEDSKETGIALESGEGVAFAGTTYSAESGNITVKNKDNTTTIENVEENDKFKIDENTFLMTAVGLVRDNSTMWTGSDNFQTVDVSKLTGSTDWTNLINQSSADLTISNTDTGILVDNKKKPTLVYGQIDSTNTLVKYSGADNEPLNSITVKNVTLGIDPAFSTVPVKLSGSNGAVVYGTSTISGTLDNVILNTMTFTPVEGNTFQVNDGTTTTEYVMKGAGLTKDNGSKIWAKTVTDNTYKDLSTDSNWLTVLKLEEDGTTLNLTSQTPTSGDNIIVDATMENRVGKLNVDDSGKYTFTKDTGTIETIQLPDGEFTIATDFDSSIEMGSGTVTVTNGSNKIYKGTNLKVATTSTTSTLYSGTVSIAAGSDKAVTSGPDTITSTTGAITATAENRAWKTIDSLQNNGAFTINDQAYEVKGTSNNFTLVKTSSSGDLIYKDFITSLPFDYSNIVDSNFRAYVELTEAGVLDLTQDEKPTNGDFLVVQNGSLIARVADLTYDGGYTLSKRDDCSPTAIEGVLLSSASALRTFTNTIAKDVHTITVTAKDTGEYAINGQSLYAEKDSAFKTYADTVILTSGTVTLSATQTYTQVTAVDSDVLAATTGKVIVKVDDSTDVITVGELDDGDEFSFNSAGYLKSKIGLANSEKTKLNTTVKGSVNSIDTANLPTTGTDWKDVENAPKGKLTIDKATPSDGYVVDLDNPKNAVYYGTIAKESNTYTYTGDKLASVTLDTAVKANVVLDKNCAGIDITAGGATFQVTASDAFTVDATGTTKSKNPIVTGVTAITLTSGTIQATEAIPITAGNYKITMPTGNDMTIGISGTTVTIDDVAIDETFTVNDGTESKNYIMKEAGLCLTDTSGNPTHIDTNGVTVSGGIATVTLNSLKVGYILKADTSDQLDFTNKDNTPQSGSNIVVNSDETKRLVNLNYSNNTYAFTKDEGTLTEIKLPDGTLTTTTDFDSTINTGNGTYTVNKLSYKGSGLEIKAIADTSTLYNGTVTLASGEKVTATGVDATTATTDDVTLKITDGDGVTATVVDGEFTKLGSINKGDSFTFDDGATTYTKNDLGLKRKIGTVETINENTPFKKDTITVSDLSEYADDFKGFIAPDSDGILNLTGDRAKLESYIYDSTDDPQTKLGTFTINDDGTLRLKPNSDKQSTTEELIKTVSVDPGIDINVSFNTQVATSAAGTITLNKQTYVGAKKLTLDSDGKTSTLYAGTLTLNTANPSAQATNDETELTIVKAAGDITAVAEEGKFITVKGLQAAQGDSFTFGGHTYTQSPVGLLREDSTICEEFKGSVNIEDLTATATEWQSYIAPTDKAIDLTNASSALVFDNTTLPTKKLGDLIVDSDNKQITLESNNATETAAAITSLTIAADTELIVDFVTDITSPEGAVIVNDAYYNGTSELNIHSDGKTSTLTKGTISLASGETVTTTTSGTTVNATGGNSGGLLMAASSSSVLTVEVDADGKINLSNISVGSTFTVAGNNYKVTEVGIMNNSGKIWTASDYKEGINDAVTELVDDTNWTTVKAVSEDLTIGDDTIAVGEKFVLVDNASNPTKRYGVLSKAAEDDYYLATSDIDTVPSSITVDKTRIEVGDEFADVPITTINGDGSTTKFTVTVEEGKDTFIVEAEDYAAGADNVSDVELEEGPFKPKDGQNVNIADGADKEKIQVLLEDGEHTIGGKAFTLAGSEGKAWATVDDDGKLSKIGGLVEGASITPKDAGEDGGKCTSTADGTVLNYSDTDGYYFDDYTKDAYNINVDEEGHVTVDAGVQFTKVVSSGRTLDSSGTIKTVVDTAEIPVTVTNSGETGLNISDSVDDLAKNFGKQSGVVFNAGGVTANDFTSAKGTTFIADKDQTVAVGDNFKAIANTDNVEVTIGDNAAAVDKATSITAPENFGLTLGAADYNVNGIELTPSGTTNFTTTSDGVIVDLATSEPFTYDDMTFSGTGTAQLAKDKNATLTNGAIATNVNDKTLNVSGDVVLDGKTLKTAEPTDVTGTVAGISVGDTNLQVFGDNIYTVNIAASGIITGLENIGAADGVTVAGLSTATVLTDAAGPFTVDRTFNAGASVLYTIDDVLTAADDVTTISGDFSKVLEVNGMPYAITGGIATLNAENGIINTGAGTFNINGKTYTTNQPTTWTTDNGTVTGADLAADGTFVINQRETNFNLEGDTLTLANNSKPVTLTVTGQSGVTEARGVNGIISGLDDATVYDVARATIDNTPIYVRNDSVDAVVDDGAVNHLTGLNSGAIVSSAPSMTVTSAENGNFTFVSDRYNITDADNSVDFLTDANSRVTNIDKLNGSVSGNGVKDLTINDKDFTTSNGNITLASDGTDITGIDGLKSGDTIGGDLEEATFTMPEGQLTMNSATYTLAGDEDGVTMSDDGKRVAGFARNASLTVGEAGSYTINGTRFNADAGDTFTSNRDGVYKFDPNNPPINDTTPASEILALSDNPVYVNSSSSAVQVIDISDEKTLALIDSPNGNTSVKTGMGNDSVIARHGGNITVDVADGDVMILTTNANVTLDNYREDGDAVIKTFDYNNIPNAIKGNDITFGDGIMTLGDAVINFGGTATTRGATFTNIINARGNTQAVGFTHTAGGTINISAESDAYVLKGNYAESDSDTQKSAGSTITGGSGNDTLLIGANDFANAGDGTNQIYVTDADLRLAGAAIVLNAGKNTVYNFSGGHSSVSDRIQVSDLGDVDFGYSSGLTMTSGEATLAFNGLKPSTDLVTLTGANTSLNAAAPYKLRITAGSTTYNAEIAQSGKALAVTDGDSGNLFYGNSNGISFSEFTGTVAVNLNDNTGSVGGRAARFYDIDKVAAGAGNSTLIGENGVKNTLMAGTGYGLIRSGAGADLMVGTDGYDKTGRTRYHYATGYGRDTITNFDFMASSDDSLSDYVEIGSEITAVSIQGSNVLISVEGNADDYLTIANAANKHFAIEGGIAKVGTNMEFDGMTEYYVGGTANSTISLSADAGDTEIWLGGEVGDTRYLGDIAVVNASRTSGENILAGNGLNNIIIGGNGKSSMWGGQGNNDDTLIGGMGQNTFFFMENNGNDLVRGVRDGDIVDLTNLDFNKITAADITETSVSISLSDGSHLTVEGSAAVDYKLSDGSTYAADHNTRSWVQKG